MSFNTDTRIIQERWEFIKDLKNIYQSNKNRIDAVIEDIRAALKEYNRDQLNESDDDILFEPVGEEPPFTSSLRDPFKRAREAGFDLPKTDRDIDSLAVFLAKKFGKMVTSKIFLVALVTLFSTSHPVIWKLVDYLSNTSAEMTDGTIGAYADKVAIEKDGTVSSPKVGNLLVTKFGANNKALRSWSPADLKYVPLKIETVEKEWEKYIRTFAERNNIPDASTAALPNVLYKLKNLGTADQPSSTMNKDCDDWACGFAGSVAMSSPSDMPNYNAALSGPQNDDERLSVGANLGGSSREFMKTIGQAGIKQKGNFGHAINIFLLDEGDGNASIAFFEPQTGKLYTGPLEDLWGITW